MYEHDTIGNCLWKVMYEYNTIGECLWKMLYQRKCNKIYDVHMKHKECLGKFPKIYETQEMYREIPKMYKLF